MQEFYLIINWFVSVAIFLLGLVAVLKNPKLTLNRLFLCFSLAVAVWILSSFISNDIKYSSHVSLIGNYIVFLSSYISSYLLLWFAISLAQDKKAAKRLKRFNIPLIAIGLIDCTPLVVSGVKRQGSVYAVTFGPLVILYFIALMTLLISTMFVLHKNIKHVHSEQKSHLKILYQSLLFALPIVLITEFILPAVTGWFGLTNVGILFFAIPVIGLYYSVVKQKLFNLRIVAIRSLAYLISLAVIGVGYGLVSYYLTTIDTFSKHTDLKVAINVLFITIAINIYQPGIKLFRKITNRLFYQDAYDPQAFLDELNKTIIDNIETRILLRHTAKVIKQYLKSSFVAFVLYDEKSDELRVISPDNSLGEFTKRELYELRRKFTESAQKIINTDGDEDLKRDFFNLLNDHDITIVSSLQTSVNEDAFVNNFFCLGPKQSGNPYTSQDIRMLEIISNELIIAIQNTLRFEEIENFNVTLQQRINDATKKLMKANEKLKDLDETKDDFISMASHQLRTPLTSIKGYTSMLLEGDAGELNQTQKDMLSQAFYSSQRMVYLISDMLNVSRLKTGKFIIERSSVNLADVVQQEINQLVETAAAKDITITYNRPESFPSLMIDETKTRQVIMNFSDNAIYYTPQGGHIDIELIDKPSSIELRVHDNGIGVPKAEQHHLFTKFYRANNARKARPDGTGLGLYMAKKVIIAQGGAVIFESEEGKGSTFGFTMSKTPYQENNPIPQADEIIAHSLK